MMSWMRSFAPTAISFLTSILLALPALAEQVRIGDVRGNDLSPSEIATVRSLLQSQLRQQPGVIVVDESARGPVSIIDAEVSRWGQGLILIVELDRPSAPPISRNTRATEFRDVDVAIADLVDEVIFASREMDPAGDALPPAPIEQPDPQRPRRGRTAFSAHLGPSWGMTDALETRGTLYDFGIGFGWDYGKYLIELRTDFLVGADDRDVFGFTGTLGWDYVWLDWGNAAIYNGIEGGIGYLRENIGASRSSRTGFAFGTSMGLLLVRDALVNIDISLRARVLSEQMNGEIPVVGGVAIGLRF